MKLYQLEPGDKFTFKGEKYLVVDTIDADVDGYYDALCVYSIRTGALASLSQNIVVQDVTLAGE